MADDFETRLAALTPRPPSIKDYVREYAGSIRDRTAEGVPVKDICRELSKSVRCDVKPATLLTYLFEIAPVGNGKRGRRRRSANGQGESEAAAIADDANAAPSSADAPTETSASDPTMSPTPPEAPIEVPRQSNASQPPTVSRPQVSAGPQTERPMTQGAPAAVTPGRLK